MNARAYLDHNATTAIRPEARQAMESAYDFIGNPSSVHTEGRKAHALMEDAREKIAGLVGAFPQNVIITSGGTEADNMALQPGQFGARAGAARCLISATEHPAVREGGGFEASTVETIVVDSEGLIDLVAFDAQLSAFRGEYSEAPLLVSVMVANNETGAIQPIAEISDRVHGVGGLMHADAVQAAGKIPLDIAQLGADMISLSAHKVGGPTGMGALVLSRSDLPLGAPLIKGGGQEQRRRGGTENLAGIAGFGAAAEAAAMDAADMSRIAGLRDELEQRLTAYKGVRIFSANAPRLPNTTCFAVPGMSSETLVIALDVAGVAVSSGAACSSGKVARSHVLVAMGVSDEMAAAAIRLSLGWNTQDSDIDAFFVAWSAIYEKFEIRRSAA